MVTSPNPKSTLFTVGMAVFDDFQGLYFTTQGLFANHGNHIGQVVVVDNNPNPRIEKYCRTIGATYVLFPEPKGTAAPRDEIFRHAKLPRTLVLDSHVLLETNALAALSAEVTNDDLYHGPIIYDWGQPCATHMDDIWRGEMWGIWGVARGNPAWSLVDGQARNIMTKEPVVANSADTIPTEKFEIPAHGMGLWACQTGSWLGFNKDFREFGGEEWYIHEKYRKAGRKVWCVPGARWRHRFSDLTEQRIPYPLSRIAKVKNYIIGHRELGLPLHRIQAEFLGKGLISQAEWDMACGCKKDRIPGTPSAPVVVPAELMPKDGKIVDFTTTEWPEGTNVIKPTQNPNSAELVDCDVLVIGDYPAALGRWSDRAARILVRGGVQQIAPFIAAKMHYSVVKSTGGWQLISSRPEDKAPMVGIGTQAKNVFKAAGKALRLSLTGQSLVEEARYDERMDKCITCPFRDNDRCTACGCFVKAKAWLVSQDCPKGFWDKVS